MSAATRRSIGVTHLARDDLDLVDVDGTLEQRRVVLVERISDLAYYEAATQNQQWTQSSRSVGHRHTVQMRLPATFLLERVEDGIRVLGVVSDGVPLLRRGLILKERVANAKEFFDIFLLTRLGRKGREETERSWKSCQLEAYAVR